MISEKVSLTALRSTPAGSSSPGAGGDEPAPMTAPSSARMGAAAEIQVPQRSTVTTLAGCAAGERLELDVFGEDHFADGHGGRVVVIAVDHDHAA